MRNLVCRRSPYLCMLIGACGMAGLGIVIAISTNRLFGTELNLYWLAMVREGSGRCIGRGVVTYSLGFCGSTRTRAWD